MRQHLFVFKIIRQRSTLLGLGLSALLAVTLANGADRGKSIDKTLAQKPEIEAVASVGYPRLDVAASANGRPTKSVMLAASSVGKRILVAGERGTIVHSDDCGASWTQAKVPVGVTLTALVFADDIHGWAVGHGGVVLSTSDAGATWSKQIDGRVIAQLALAAARKAEAKAHVDSKRLKRAIEDAERMVTDGPDKPLFAAHFSTAKKGIVVGAFGLALATEDGGVSWQWIADRMPNPKGLHLYGVWAKDDQVYVVGEHGLILRSSDRGRKFQSVTTPYVGSYFGITGSSRSKIPEVLIYGLLGHAYRMSVETKFFEHVNIATQASVLSVLPRTDGSSLFFDGDGQIFELGSAGASTNRIAASPVGPVLGAASACGKSVVLAGMRGIAVVQPTAMTVAISKGVAK